MTTYQISASQYARGMKVVQPDDPSPLAPTARLCRAFSGNRYTTRERGYLMTDVTLTCFRRAASYGCESPDGCKVEWRSPDGMREHTFDPRHPGRALTLIKRDRAP